MSELVGYVTVEYADQYVQTHLLTSDKLREVWEGLLPADKSALLLKSFEALETLPFTGRRFKYGQQNAFPRYPQSTVPTVVQHAQIENALSLADNDEAEDAVFYERLWKWGVDSYSIGNLSEHTSSGAWGRGTPVAQGVTSSRAISMLQPYLNGGYTIGGSCR